MNRHLVKSIAAVTFLILATVTGVMAETPSATRTAIFAGGNFWCMEPPFEALDGVVSVVAGYTGGYTANPTNATVTAGGTGHTEAVLVTYDPAKITYQKLLDVFWRNIDPTDPEGQFVDRGNQFRAAIFTTDAEQRQLAEASKKELEASWRFAGMFNLGKIVTEVTPAGIFYPAEEEHQDYYRKHPLYYRYVRWNSGRDSFIERCWPEKKP